MRKRFVHFQIFNKKKPPLPKRMCSCDVRRIDDVAFDTIVIIR